MRLMGWITLLHNGVEGCTVLMKSGGRWCEVRKQRKRQRRSLVTIPTICFHSFELSFSYLQCEYRSMYVREQISNNFTLLPPSLEWTDRSVETKENEHNKPSRKGKEKKICLSFFPIFTLIE